VLDHLGELVVNSANESGGYGMLIGPHSTKEQQAEFATKIKAAPRNYIRAADGWAVAVADAGRRPPGGRHVDLRP